MHFLKLLDTKNKLDHETVAFFEASRQQKRARPRDCCIFHTSKHQKRASQRTSQKSNFDRPPKTGVPVLQSYLKRTIFRPSRGGGPQESFSGRLSPGSKIKPEHETVTFFEAFRQQKRARPRDCCIFGASRQQKPAVPRDCCGFWSF